MGLITSFVFAFILCSTWYQDLAHALGGSNRILFNAELPEMSLNVSEIIEHYGYPCENHEVKTEDGYILSVQRIVHGRKNNEEKKGVILIQHGLLDSATSWVLNTPSDSLAFILADSGYEVWLSNSRGNTYSKKHVKYTRKDSAYWNFSFDEMAKFDLPAIINHILKTTGVEKIFYAGHSQGTMMAFIEFSRNQELAEKIHTFFALAPVATIGHIKGGFKVLSYFTTELKLLLRLFGIHEFLPNDKFFKFLAGHLCSNDVFTKIACETPIFLLCGLDVGNLNDTRMPAYINHTPAGTSVKNVYHFAQMIRNDKFQMYDNGWVGNLVHYHQLHPPQYNITGLKVPTVLFSGTHDWLSDSYDIENYLLPAIGHTVIHHEVIEGYNHLDFTWGMNAHSKVYEKIVSMMDSSYNSV